MRYILPENWVPTDEKIKLEKNADFVVKSDCNVIVTAGPGAGKTEMLAQRANYLLMTNNCLNPFKILAISFKKDAAENLKKRVVSRCGEFAKDRFISLTFDSFAKRVLDQYIAALPNEIRPNSNYLILEDKNVDAWNLVESVFSKYSIGRGEFETERAFKRRAQQILDSLKLRNLGLLSSDQKEMLLLLIKGGVGSSSVLTYGLIKEMALIIFVRNREILNVVRQTYSHVFLDEFQDTTEIQYELVKTCFKNTNVIMTAVGDEKQRIMVWAGALLNAFDLFKSDFSAEPKQLVQNHRSAPKIVLLQKAMYDLLNASSENVVYADKWNEFDGRIVLAEIDTDENEKFYVVNEIRRYVSQGVLAKDICIICRNNPGAFTSSIIAELGKNDIYARLEADFMDLTKSPVVQVFLSFLNMLLVPNSDDWNVVIDCAVKSRNVDIKNEKAYFDLISATRNLLSQLNKDKDLVFDFKSMSCFIDQISSFFNVEGLKQVYAEYANGSVLNELLIDFKLQFWNSFVKMKQSWQRAVGYFKGECSIPIMTIHKSKGLEYKVVFILGLEDQMFFGFRNRPEEERCNFFVAMSRAKTDLIFTYCGFRSQDQRNPQRNHVEINEFHELLRNSGLAETIKISKGV